MSSGTLFARSNSIQGLFFNPTTAPVVGPDFGRLTPRGWAAGPVGIPGWQCVACRVVVCTYPGREAPRPASGDEE